MELLDVTVADIHDDMALPLGIPNILTLQNMEEIRDYIFNMDMSMILYKMTDEESAGELGLLWERADAEFAINQYRQYLYLVRKYETHISPTLAIDAVWHNHILDTRKYVRDCQVIFGRYLHHFPYFGNRDEEDRRQLDIAFENTKRLFRAEYGVDVTRIPGVD
ncbi:glycine-rich domain-containing protein [Aestuariispira insulae]|uniref:Uncharacterized protein DUF1399 n=1 Tax=Aestuariispira insulae TaxID=1461337 RepID=A0A3D9HMR8_9PROT|nr:glycine-rich domain-containing protein-like [Aestuariispira insulae]RED50759.1 uncharacterized protein DUF1399 [Aestuariispira insulae]